MHAEAVAADWRMTSGGFGPTVGGPVAMGYVGADLPQSAPALGRVARQAHAADSCQAALCGGKLQTINQQERPGYEIYRRT